MSNIVNAKGLSCPQPVILTINEMKNVNKGEIIIMVDTDTSKDAYYGGLTFTANK